MVAMHSLFNEAAHPTLIHGSIIEAPLKGVSVGELCLIKASLLQNDVVSKAQVVGFHQGKAVLSLLGSANGLSLQVVIEPTGSSFLLDISENLLGKVLDANGVVAQSLTEQLSRPDAPIEQRSVNGTPPLFSERRPITERLITGVRVIDSLLTCGQGQRIGIFAAAGCGKTSLMNMLIDHSDADVYVVALVGERGREVTEFVRDIAQSPKGGNVIVVYATSDRPSVERCNAAMIATAIAEYFRDQGKNVVLFVDSMTRYARALRDVALAAGELPARRGYPASIFESLPRLLERPGKTAKGIITAFYTVLLENEEEPDPIGDEIRSILDGHIYLSQKLAAVGHFPAIDVLKSASRVFTLVVDKPQRLAASQMRDLLSRQKEMQLFIDMGEYRPGENAENDRAMELKEEIESFLRQPMDESSSYEETLERFYDIVA